MSGVKGLEGTDSARGLIYVGQSEERTNYGAETIVKKVIPFCALTKAEADHT